MYRKGYTWKFSRHQTSADPWEYLPVPDPTVLTDAYKDRLIELYTNLVDNTDNALLITSYLEADMWHEAYWLTCNNVLSTAEERMFQHILRERGDDYQSVGAYAARLFPTAYFMDPDRWEISDVKGDFVLVLTFFDGMKDVVTVTQADWDECLRLWLLRYPELWAACNEVFGG